jgi:tetratricopeptide (TPR) repeat protein
MSSNSLYGDDTGAFWGAKIGLLQLEPDPSTDVQLNMETFGDNLRDASYNPVEVEGPSPEQILEENPDVLLVVAGTFREGGAPFRVRLHWRPNGSWGINPVGINEENLIEDVAAETIRYIENDITKDLREYTSTLHKSDAEKLCDQAEDAFSHRRYEQVVKIASQALEASPTKDTKSKILYLQARAFKRLGDWDSSRETFEAVRELHPKDDSALLELGNLDFSERNLRRAEEYYTRVIGLKSVNEVKARHNLALVYQSQGKLHDAMELIEGIPEKSVHGESVSQLKAALFHAIKTRERRAAFFYKIWIALLVLAVIVIAGIIYMIYRRSQRDPGLTAAQRLDFAGKLMGGLFSMLSLLAGTMIGLFIAQ